jgi:hypothetical protein
MKNAFDVGNLESTLARRLARPAALGFLGFLGALGFIPGWDRLLGLSGFFGFFGFIGIAQMVESQARFRGRSSNPPSAVIAP